MNQVVVVADLPVGAHERVLKRGIWCINLEVLGRGTCSISVRIIQFLLS
jgi:hypothetical protein